jgi:predicted dehydrogenase
MLDLTIDNVNAMFILSRETFCYNIFLALLVLSQQLSAISRRHLFVQSFVITTASLSTMSSSSGDNLVRWGIIGLGDVTQQKSGPPFWKCTGSVLVAVFRRTPGKAAEWASRVPLDLNHNHPCIGYDNIDDFLQQNLDAVYIATRPGSHLELCQKVAKAGIPAAYVEKPAGRCAAETQAMADLMNHSEGSLYTAYISRAYPRTQAVRHLLESGVIGEHLEQVRYRLKGTGGARDIANAKSDIPWRLEASQSGGGLIMDVGCHVLDRIDWLCGPITVVQSMAERRVTNHMAKVEDYVRFEGTIGSCDWSPIVGKGATVLCSWEFGSNEEEMDCLELIGPKGSICMAAMSPSLPVRVHDKTGNIVLELDFDVPEHTAQFMIQAITDELRGLGSKPFISRADNAIRTSGVLDQALMSYYGNREIGFWNSPELWPGNALKIN